MPINRIEDRQGRGRLQFEFDRRIGKRRIRARKILPATWSRARADAFDRQECARLYAQATGIETHEWTVDDAVGRYLDDRAAELKTGPAIAAELAALAGYWQGRPLADLHDVCAEITRDYRAVVAPATLMNKLRYLIAACRWGWKRGRMGQHDPGAGIAMPAVRNARHVYADRRLMLELARACPHRGARAAIRVAFYSGMRRGEILRADAGPGVFVLEDTKNGERRLVPVPERVRCCARYEWPSKYVLGYWFRKARAAVGRPDLRFHDLRHSTASALLGEGVELRTVGLILGHKSTASTARYAHLALDKQRAALDKIGRPTSSPPSPPQAGPKPAGLPMEARAGVEPTYSDLQSRKRA